MARRITGKQRAARKRNIKIARTARKKVSKKINISTASSLLKKKGLILGRSKIDLKSKTTSYKITSSKTGRSAMVSVKKLRRILSV